MRTVFRIYFKADGARPWTVLLALLAASVVEGVGFITLVPLLSVLTSEAEDDQSQVTAIARQVAEHFDIEFQVGPLLLVFAGAMVVKSVCVFFAMRHVGHTIAEVVTRLRRRIVEHLLNVRWGYLVKHPVGRVTHYLSGAAAQVGLAYSSCANFFANSIQTATYLLVGFVVSWQISAGALLAGSLMAISLHFLVSIARKAGYRQTLRLTELMIFLVDALNNIKPLKSMAKQSAFANLFDKKINSVRKALKRQVITKQALKNLNEILLSLTLGIGFYLAITVWQVKFVDLLVVGILLSKSVRGISKLQDVYQKAAIVEAPCEMIEEFLMETAAAREEQRGHRAATLEHSCRLEDVVFGYGEKHVLDSVSIEVPAKKITVLTGPSGSGKTTIADLIIGLYPPDEGRVTLDGVPLTEIKTESWRSQIGYVPQELVLFNDSIYANVSLGDKNVGEAEVKKALEQAGAWEFVNDLPEGMMSPVGEKGSKLSGGQRQRIALARGLASNPRLLILDEVTSALDPATEQDICQNIRALKEEMTVLAITHRPAFLDIADRVYRVSDGVVLESRDAEEVAFERLA